MIRRRFEGEKDVKTDIEYTQLIDTPKKDSIHSISSFSAVVAIIIGVLLYDGIVKLSARSPTQLKIADEVSTLLCMLHINNL